MSMRELSPLTAAVVAELLKGAADQVGKPGEVDAGDPRMSLGDDAGAVSPAVTGLVWVPGDDEAGDPRWLLGGVDDAAGIAPAVPAATARSHLANS